MLPALLLFAVVSVFDGDTLTARCAADDGPSTIRVRLAVMFQEVVHPSVI
jgi:hypothetical protein